MNNPISFSKRVFSNPCSLKWATSSAQVCTKWKGRLVNRGCSHSTVAVNTPLYRDVSAMDSCSGHSGRLKLSEDAAARKSRDRSAECSSLAAEVVLATGRSEESLHGISRILLGGQSSAGVSELPVTSSGTAWSVSPASWPASSMSPAVPCVLIHPWGFGTGFRAGLSTGQL